MKDPTSQQVADFHVEILRRFDAKIRDKSDSARMRAASWFLDKMGIMDAEEFMNNYTTVIPPVIYASYRVADPSSIPLWSQIKCVTHECQHIYQAQQDGFVTFTANYAGSKVCRASYEAEAYSCDIELEYWRTGLILDARIFAKKLLAYNCDKEDVEFAEKMLLSRIDTIKSGGIINKASQVAIEIMEEKMPEIRNLKKRS